MRNLILPLRPFGLLGLVSLSAAAASAQISTGNPAYTEASYSTSQPAAVVAASSDPEPAAPAAAAAGAGVIRATQPASTSGYRPFSGVGLAVKVGTTGIGFDMSTPLAQHFALRTGASFFSYNTSLTESGININGDLHLQSATASLDIYPFRHNSFRLSPGINFSNHNRVSGTLLVPGGQTFSFGDGGTYYSSASDPVRGTADFNFGKRLAPRMTMGWGNIMPHAGARVSVPLEFGFQYTAPPTASLAVTGSSCGSQVQSDGSVESGCGPVDQTDVAQEQSDLQKDVSMLRFYPVVSIGISVRIGGGRRSE